MKEMSLLRFVQHVSVPDFVKHDIFLLIDLDAQQICDELEVCVSQ
jgi:hypothetical protein